MEPLRWLFELRDLMSHPLRKMLRALRETRSGLREVQTGTAEVETGFSGFISKTARMLKSLATITVALVSLGRAAMFLGGLGFFRELPKVFAALKTGGLRGFLSEGGAALGRMGDTFLDRIGLARSSAGQLGNRLMEGLRAMRPAAARALKIGAGLAVAGLAAYGLFRGLSSVLSVSIRIGAAIGDWTRQFGEAVLQARLMRERTTFGLTLLTGSRGGAAEVLDEARRLSEFLGTDLHETVAGIQELLVRGFSRRESSSIFQAMADLRAISPRPVDTSRILLAIGQIRQAGRLQGDELNQLAESGLPLDAIRQRMATNLGTTVSELRSLQSAGRISSDVAIRSIMEGIGDVTGGPLGQAGRDFSFTLPGLLERLRAMPTRIFDAIAAGSDSAFGRVRDILMEVNGLLDTNSAGFRRVIEVGVAGFDTLVEGLRTAWEFGRVFFEGLAIGFGADPGTSATDALADMREALVSLRSDPEALRFIKVLGATFAGAALTIATVVRVLWSVGLMFNRVFFQVDAAARGFLSWLTELPARALAWGRDIVGGLIQGIMSMFEPLRSAGASIATVVRSAVSGGLDMHSPSRVMMELGALTGEGFALGLASSMPDVGRVATPQLGSAARGAGRGRGPISLNLELNVQGGGDPEAQAESIRRAVVPELEAFLDQLAVEHGVG